MATSCAVRSASSNDYTLMAMVERATFAHGPTQDDLRILLRQPTAGGFIAEQRGLMSGYAVYADRPSFRELVSIAVLPEFRRRGVGQQLMTHIVLGAYARTTPAVQAMVWERNLAGQLFLRACGFKAIEIVRQPYLDSLDDAYTMHYSAPEYGQLPLVGATCNAHNSSRAEAIEAAFQGEGQPGEGIRQAGA